MPESIELAPDMEIEPAAVLRRVILELGKRHKYSWRRREPFFGTVTDLTLHGSGYSSAICRWAGVDPFTGRPLPPEVVDHG